MPDGRLAYVDDGGIVDFKDVVKRHCERKERERGRAVSFNQLPARRRRS